MQDCFFIQFFQLWKNILTDFISCIRSFLVGTVFYPKLIFIFQPFFNFFFFHTKERTNIRNPINLCNRTDSRHSTDSCSPYQIMNHCLRQIISVMCKCDFNGLFRLFRLRLKRPMSDHPPCFFFR